MATVDRGRPESIRSFLEERVGLERIGSRSSVGPSRGTNGAVLTRLAGLMLNGESLTLFDESVLAQPLPSIAGSFT